MTAEEVCARFEARFQPPAAGATLGVALPLSGDPLNALRHPEGASACGWYVWTGDLSDDADFFQPLHVSHIGDIAPRLAPYLALPPGWRVQLGENGYEDVWFDPSRLIVSANDE